jgi:hypothetical protein
VPSLLANAAYASAIRFHFPGMAESLICVASFLLMSLCFLLQSLSLPGYRWVRATKSIVGAGDSDENLPLDLQEPRFPVLQPITNYPGIRFFIGFATYLGAPPQKRVSGAAATFKPFSRRSRYLDVCPSKHSRIRLATLEYREAQIHISEAVSLFPSA